MPLIQNEILLYHFGNRIYACNQNVSAGNSKYIYIFFQTSVTMSPGDGVHKWAPTEYNLWHSVGPVNMPSKQANPVSILSVF